jgi:uncharacterized protein YjiS (DUF1127 family)
MRKLIVSAYLAGTTLHARSLRLWRSMLAGVRMRCHRLAKHRGLPRAERQLVRLNDRMLKDIGIARSDIWRVVRYGRS